ncbi:MAG: apolipoprotein N-acyltransferase, partial [bacterium]
LSAAAWVVLEWGYPKVFVWSLGAAVGPDRWLRQAAELGGAYGLAALAVAVNALLAGGGRLPAAIAAAMAVSAFGYGQLRVAGLDAHADLARLRVGVVQAGSGDEDDPRSLTDAAWRFYGARSPVVARHADLVVWPEGVLRTYLGDRSDARDGIERLASRLRRPLVLGGLDHAAARERNAVFVFAPQLIAVRHKQGLVPFGEYVPGVAWLPWLRAWRTTGDFDAGAAPQPLAIAGTRAGLAVCVEAIRPGAFNAQVRDGAQWLLNLTDDSWFASRHAAALHLELTRLRAVETRRWLVRASHSGASAVFDPQGDLVAALPFGLPGTLNRPVGLGEARTPYVRYGDWVVFLAAAALLASAGAALRRRLQRSAAEHTEGAEAEGTADEQVSSLRPPLPRPLCLCGLCPPIRDLPESTDGAATLLGLRNRTLTASSLTA